MLLYYFHRPDPDPGFAHIKSPAPDTERKGIRVGRNVFHTLKFLDVGILTT